MAPRAGLVYLEAARAAATARDQQAAEKHTAKAMALLGNDFGPSE